MSIAAAVATGAITADTSAAGGELLVAARTLRKGLIVQNRSTTDSVYVGAKTVVTTANGLEIPVGQSMPFSDFSGELYVVVAVGKSCDVRYLEAF